MHLLYPTSEQAAALTAYGVDKVDEWRRNTGDQAFLSEYSRYRQNAGTNPLEGWQNAPLEAVHAQGVVGASTGPGGGGTGGGSGGAPR
jgi:hypothetical protein